MEQMKTENIQVKTRMITLNCTIQWKNSENNVPEQEYSILSVEALRHRGPRGHQMDAPSQLKMVPASVNLQKMSRHTLRWFC